MEHNISIITITIELGITGIFQIKSVYQEWR